MDSPIITPTTSSSSNNSISKSKRILELNNFINNSNNLNNFSCTPAWSCTNLLAIPNPTNLTTTSNNNDEPLTVTLTHFTGTNSTLNFPYNNPTLNINSTENGKGKGKATSSSSPPSNRLSFILTLPNSNNKTNSNNSRITRLSFAPCGGHLFVSTSTINSNDSNNSNNNNDLIYIFEQKSGCINEWNLTWCENLNSFGEDVGIQGKKIIELRWLGEPRKWYPKRNEHSTEEEEELTPNGISHRPLFCAPHRSPPVVGSAFLLILSSDELLFVHIPRSLPLLPMTVVLPLSSPLSLSALPTAPSYSPQSTLSTSSNTVPGAAVSGEGVEGEVEKSIDNLIANLVEVMPSNGPSPSVIVNALAGGSVLTSSPTSSTFAAGANGTTGGSAGGGTGALKEELRAAERKDRRGLGGKRVGRASMGMVRGSQSADWGLTTFLIATCSTRIISPPSKNTTTSSPTNSIIPLPTPIPSTSTLPVPQTSSTTALIPPAVGGTVGSPNLSDFELAFDSLDEAFGDDPPLTSTSILPTTATSISNTTSNKSTTKPKTNYLNNHLDSNRIDLCELKVELTAQGGPRLTLRPLSPINVIDPTELGSSIHCNKVLMNLDWLEDLNLPAKSGDLSNKFSTASAAGSNGDGEEKEEGERECDLSLIAVLGGPNGQGGFESNLTSWAFSNSTYKISDSFSNLDLNKKIITSPSSSSTANNINGSAKNGNSGNSNREWSGRRMATSLSKDLITFVIPRLGPVFSSFMVGKHTFGDDLSLGEAICTKIWAMNSITLEPLDGFIPTQLPGLNIYGRAQISPNRGLLCALPFTYQHSIDTTTSSGSLPALVAVPLSTEGRIINALGDHLAIAIARQVDASDLVGRVLGLKDEAATIQIVRHIRDTLQAMLPSGRSFEASTLQVELMGIISILYSSIPGLQLRGSIAFNVIELAACVRVFQKCEKRERTMADSSYRCESDAVWPLIGHIKWFCGFCKELVLEIQESGPVASSPRLLLILQPYTRGLMVKIADYALALQAFLASFPVNANVTVDLSRSVLEDTIQFNGLNVKEFRKILLEFGQSQTVELSVEKPQTKELLIEFIIPPNFLPASSQLFQLIFNNSNLITILPPTPPTSPLHYSNHHSINHNTLDVIRKGKLPGMGNFRMCTRCRGRSEKTEMGGSETGRWQAYELGWEVRCSCGGLWYSLV